MSLDEPPYVKRHAPRRGTRIEPPPRKFPPWERNWIDFRASRARIHRRAETGDLAQRCIECRCEADVVPVPHSPRCTQADT